MVLTKEESSTLTGNPYYDLTRKVAGLPILFWYYIIALAIFLIVFIIMIIFVSITVSQFSSLAHITCILAFNIQATGSQAWVPNASAAYANGAFEYHCDQTMMDGTIYLHNLSGDQVIRNAYFKIGNDRPFSQLVKSLNFVPDPIHGGFVCAFTWTENDFYQPLSNVAKQAILAQNLYIDILTDSYPFGEVRGLGIYVPV